MDVNQLQTHLVEYTKSLFREGFLDDQFQQLQQLQDESTPSFVFEVVSLFFDDSQKIINALGTALEQAIVDYKVIDANVHQLKGSSSSVGAQRVKNVCIFFRDFCEKQNFEGCCRALQQLKNEFSLVKLKLQYLFDLEQQIMAAGGSIPMLVFD